LLVAAEADLGLVKGYALAAGLSAIVAVMSGPETPRAVFWLYVAGAVLFALAAFGQYKKEQKQRK
jgi:hypothetical protein